MSTSETPDLVLEWSPEEVRAYWPGNRTMKTGATIADATDRRTASRALVLVSRRSSFIRSTRLPNVGGRDLQMLVKNSLPGLVPLPPTELAFDVHQSGDMNNEGRLTLISAMLNAYLTRINAEAKEAGISIAGVVPAGFAASMIAQRVGLRDAAVVEEVAGGLNIDLVSDGLIRYSRLAMPAGDMATEVARTYAAAGLPEAEVIVAGESGLESRYHSQLTSIKAAAEFDIRRLPMNLELTSEIDRRLEKELQSRRRLALYILVAAVCAAAYIFDGRYDQYSRVSAQVAKTTKALKDANDKVALQTKRIQRVTPIMQLVGRGFEPPQHLVDVLRIVSNDAPDGMWLSGVSLERGKPFTVRGAALNAEAVTTYLAKLGAEPRLRDVKLVFAQDAVIASQPIVQFSVQGFPVGNLPLVDDAKSKSAPSPAKPAGGGA